MGWQVWVPYRGLPNTNEALKMLRSDGYQAGRDRGTSWHRSEYNEHAAAVKQAVALHARAALRDLQLLGAVRLTVYFAVYASWDDDAGLIPGKWVLDGLVLAGLCKRDRRVFKGVTVETVREWQDMPQPMCRQPAAQGILVHVDPA